MPNTLTEKSSSLEVTSTSNPAQAEKENKILSMLTSKLERIERLYAEIEERHKVTDLAKGLHKHDVGLCKMAIKYFKSKAGVELTKDEESLPMLGLADIREIALSYGIHAFKLIDHSKDGGALDEELRNNISNYVDSQQSRAL